MPYRHYGEIGDVWKHLPLCEILTMTHPRVYVETNAAFAGYALAETPARRYGVMTTYRHAARSPVVDGSAYLRILRDLNERAPVPHAVLGSPGLAMHLLHRTCRRYVCFDLESDPLADIDAAARVLGLAGRVETRCADSRRGARSLVAGLGPEAFLHVDPYELFEPGEDGAPAYLDVVGAAARRAIPCMAWYGYFTLAEQAAARTRVRAFAADHPDAGVASVEVWMAAVGDTKPAVDPGIVGCGVLLINLPEAVRAVVDSLAAGLVAVYAEDVTFAGGSGALKAARICG
jgi:23S rRNA (adenine2030-N6)-methyltransferase